MEIGFRKNRPKLSEAEATPFDTLSSLPDSLIHHILSFLQIKEVVASSTLSKRWQYVWTSVDTFDFTSLAFRLEDYALIVDKVIHKAECIKRIILVSLSRCSESDVRNWMSFGLDHGVQCLQLTFLHLNIKPPHSLFTSKTLVKLEIMNADIRSANVPNAPFLPKLKELRLPALEYDTESLKRFITGCPTLELLSLSTGNLVVEALDISSPTLKRLELNSYEQHSETILLGKSPDFKVDKILLNVPALEFFRVQHPVYVIIIEDKLSSLVEADIFIGMYSHDSYHEIISIFFQLISKVKILRLRTIDRPMISAMHAQFPNLTKLEIVSPDFELILVQLFLEAAMNLEVITMDKVIGHPIFKFCFDYFEEHQIAWNEPLHVPKCLLSSFKRMSIKGYEGETELDMVNYVLRNAIILEKMEIHCPDRLYDNETKSHMLQKITMMNRGSKSCQISFC